MNTLEKLSGRSFYLEILETNLQGDVYNVAARGES